jgi:hypothetical protein
MAGCDLDWSGGVRDSTKSDVAPPAGSAAGDATNKLDHSGDSYVK